MGCLSEKIMYIHVTPLARENKYQLDEDVIIDGVRIEAGFQWNGASNPRFFWRILGSPFQPKYMVPSLVHDYLYSLGQASGYSRREADKLFFKLLIANGVNRKLAKTLYSGVRVGGGSHYG